MKTFLVLLLILSSVLVSCTATSSYPEPAYFDSSIIKYVSSSNKTGGYQHEYSISAVNLNPGSSAATFIAPSVSSLGGYWLNGLGEYLFYGVHIETDWDGLTDGIFELYFEVNKDNTGGLVTDTVKFQLEVWHKLEGEFGCTVESLNSNTVVGQSSQHELFLQAITIPNLRSGENLNFRLNLDTITSEVKDVIVNYVRFKYQTFYPALES